METWKKSLYMPPKKTRESEKKFLASIPARAGRVNGIAEFKGEFILACENGVFLLHQPGAYPSNSFSWVVEEVMPCDRPSYTVVVPPV